MDGACVDVRGVLVRQPFFCLDSLSQLASHVGNTGANCKNKLIYFSVGLIIAIGAYIVSLEKKHPQKQRTKMLLLLLIHLT